MIAMGSNSIFTFYCTSGTIYPNGENIAPGIGGLQLSLSVQMHFYRSSEPHYCQHVFVHRGGMQYSGCDGLNLHVVESHLICGPRVLGQRPS